MVRIDALEAHAYRVPTDGPEGDGTLRWDSTTLGVVEVRAGGRIGLGWSYGSAAMVRVVDELLEEVVLGADALAVKARTREMVARVRNVGAGGVAAQAISAVDLALWDLKARLLEQPLAVLLDPVRSEVPVYGSGGFVTYDAVRLERQLLGWVEQGIGAVKIKVGADPGEDPERMRLARAAIGGDTALMIDANGAFRVRQALEFAQRAADLGVVWFEEPVPSDDLDGLRLIREQGPPGVDVAAGEYGWRPIDLRRILEARAVDVLQIDVTRCHGLTGFLEAAALARSFGVPISTHTAPALHVAAGCASPGVLHLEWFHDHARIERMLFDGVPVPIGGAVAPDLGRPGLGIELKRADAQRYAL